MVTERGAVIVDGFKQNITVYSHTNQRPTWQYWGSDMNQAMISEFISAIRDGREPSITGVDGLRAVEVVLAAYDSARTGQPVQIQ
jgi:predicted dehydrogenase